MMSHAREGWVTREDNDLGAIHYLRIVWGSSEKSMEWAKQVSD